MSKSTVRQLEEYKRQYMNMKMSKASYNRMLTRIAQAKKDKELWKERKSTEVGQ